MKSLILDQVSKAFDGKPVLQQVSLQVNEGEILCLMGKSGIGKTTLLRLLMGFIRPDSGRILGLPERISAVFQEDRLLPSFSAIDNIRFVTGKQTDTALIRQHLCSLDLAESLHTRRCDTLSGGERRRVAIARALLHDSRLLLLDEAFKGLDAQTRAQTIGYVLKHRAGRMLIAVTHEDEEVQLLGGRTIVL